MIQESFLWTGVWAALICALDYNFLMCCDARPDIMCAAVGIWAIALRSEWLAAVTCLIHPFGPLYAIALAIIKRKVNWIPYLIAALGWGIYIAQAPDIFLEQFYGGILVHTTQVMWSNGLAVYKGFGEGWRLVVLATYVLCAAGVALKQRDIAIYLALIVMPAFFLTRASTYFPHAIPWLALCVAIQMRKYPWLALILIPLVAFAITSLFPVWSWTGVSSLR